MTMNSMLNIKILKNGKFVGLTKNTIEYGLIKFDQKA